MGAPGFMDRFGARLVLNGYPIIPIQPGTVPPSSLLAGKLVALRRRHVLVAMLTGLAMAVVVGIELLALAMFVDWWLALPWGLRLVSLAAQFAAFTAILLRQVINPWLRQLAGV